MDPRPSYSTLQTLGYMNESQTDGPRAIEIKICGGEYWRH